MGANRVMLNEIGVLNEDWLSAVRVFSADTVL